MEQSTSQKQSLPLGTQLLGVFLLVCSLIALASAVTLVHPGTPLDAMWSLKPPAYTEFTSHRAVSIVLLFMLAPILALTGTGLLRGRRWAWYMAVALLAINALGDGLRLLTGIDPERLSAVLIAGGLLVYLLRPAIRQRFTS